MEIKPLLACGLLAACGGAAGTAGPDSAPVDIMPDREFGVTASTPATSPGTNQVAFGLLLNDERGAAGILPVSHDIRLSAAAQGHADEMVEYGYLSHTDRDGGSVGDRALEAGYDYSFVGENIAEGYATDVDVMDAWMASPGHAANILDTRAVDFGIGREDDTWVMIVGAER